MSVTEQSRSEQDRPERDGAHTVGRWVRDRARTDAATTAVDDRGIALCYGELDERAQRLALLLHANGYRVGDRLATLTGNSADHVVVFMACARAGLILAPLSWRLSPRELSAQILSTDPRLLLVEEEFSTLARASLSRLVRPVPVTSLGVSGIERQVPQVTATGTSLADVALPAVADDDPLLLLFTSGTASQPRGALLTHANCFWTSLSMSRAQRLTADDVVLSVLPQFHVGGWTIQALLAWWTGATVVLERVFDAGRVLRLIEEKRVTTMMGVPANYLLLAQHPDFATSDLSSLRYALVGGAPMPEPLLRTWLHREVELVQGYGLTEAAPNVLCLPLADARRKLGYAGKPYPHVDVELADPATGARLDGVATGELIVRGPNVFAGYWRDPAATALALRDGWLHTGDLAHRDGEGFFKIIDRIDDVYVSGGENVSPAEIEAVLFEHPAVADVAVTGQVDERWGEVGIAYVVIRAARHTDADELLAFCRKRLAGFKTPRAVVFVSELPRSSVGKIVRRSLPVLDPTGGVA